MYIAHEIARPRLSPNPPFLNSILNPARRGEMLTLNQAMVGSSALMGLSLFLFATVNTEASNVGLNAMVRTILKKTLPMCWVQKLFQVFL